MNLQYDHEKLGVTVLQFDQPDMSYEFNTALFIATNDGRVYFVQDSGCSCPTPFEDYEGATFEDIAPRLERVGSIEQAEGLFNAWNHPDYQYHPYLTGDAKDRLRRWFDQHFGL